MLKNLITDEYIYLHRVIPQLTQKHIVIPTDRVREGLEKYCTDYTFTKDDLAVFVLGKENVSYFNYLTRYFKQLDPIFKIRRKYVKEQFNQTENYIAYQAYKNGESVIKLAKKYNKSRQWFHKYFKKMELGECHD